MRDFYYKVTYKTPCQQVENLDRGWETEKIVASHLYLDSEDESKQESEQYFQEAYNNCKEDDKSDIFYNIAQESEKHFFNEDADGDAYQFIEYSTGIFLKLFPPVFEVITEREYYKLKCEKQDIGI